MSAGFQKTIHLALVHKCAIREWVSTFEGIIFAFANLPPSNIVLTLLVDAHCHLYEVDHDTEMNGELERRSRLPNDFLIRVMLRYSNVKQRTAKDELDPCDYHENESE
jgi:hypothetical protein